MPLIDRCFQPAHASALAIFRIGFGLILFWDMIRYGFFLGIEHYYQAPHFLFYYWDLDWIQPLSHRGMQLLYLILAFASLGITLGLLYRLSTLIFICIFSYIFLLDEARYLNHFYMVWLFAVLLLFIPANRIWSFDRLITKTKTKHVPQWCYWLLIFQLEVILIYAGIVKITPDWLALEPLRTWLAKRAEMPIFGDLFTQEWAVATAAYGVIALHLLGAPLLLFKRTRALVITVYACFHTLNHFVFTIGIFPWMTLFTSLLVFGANWPLKFWARLTRKLKQLKVISTQPTAQKKAYLSENKKQNTANQLDITAPSKVALGFNQQTFIVFAIVSWCTLQLIIPLRHYAYPGNVAWTEQGHHFSWRMKLRSKRGEIKYHLLYSDGRTKTVDPAYHLNKRQVRKLPCHPNMIWKFAHFLEKEYSFHSNPVVAVNADARCSLNGREKQAIVSAETNLLTIEYTIAHSPWILPLTTPLKANKVD